MYNMINYIFFFFRNFYFPRYPFGNARANYCCFKRRRQRDTRVRRTRAARTNIIIRECRAGRGYANETDWHRTVVALPAATGGSTLPPPGRNIVVRLMRRAKRTTAESRTSVSRPPSSPFGCPRRHPRTALSDSRAPTHSPLTRPQSNPLAPPLACLLRFPRSMSFDHPL